ncbi:unnamed protein product [Calicophoron daubneyi]|uniref:Aldehyde dehydrogenase domain-containing protein n=1 Tax=Calicophoron daubneyi TaxID=300641 RepID=A0AAV2U009_CALDB
MDSKDVFCTREDALKRLEAWLSSNEQALKLAFGPRAQQLEEPFSTAFEPATGLPLVRYRDTSMEELDVIVTEANRAQQRWMEFSPSDRANILHKVAELVREEASWLAEMETLDTGKPLWETQADVAACADSIDLFADLIPSISRTDAPEPPNPESYHYTRREPYGVCAGIGTWNSPFQTAVWKSAPALGAGNAMVFKPSPLTPVTVVRLSELYTKGGCPEHLFSVVLGGTGVGRALVSHSKITKVSFTGNAEGGRLILGATAKKLIPGTIELGGKSALIIMPDGDIDEAVKGALVGGFHTQTMASSNAARVYVHRSISPVFQKKLLDAVHRIEVGDPFSPHSSMGAVISAEHLRKMKSFIHSSILEGANLLCGGDVPSFPAESLLHGGNFIRPSILTNCHDEMTAVKEEISGPLLTLLRFETEEEVIRRLNLLFDGLGLTGSVFSKNLATATRIASKLKCSSVYVNSFNTYPPGIPFGGYEKSSRGRENAIDTLIAYTQTKTVYLRAGQLSYPFLT